jgi:hypothetical protein
VRRERIGGEREVRERGLLHDIQHTKSSSRDMNTTLNTFFLVAGSTEAAILKVLSVDLNFLRFPGTA